MMRVITTCKQSILYGRAARELTAHRLPADFPDSTLHEITSQERRDTDRDMVPLQVIAV